jgi:hypothetical protein
MIRFVDLGKQLGIDEEWPREFCFYNTVTSMFVDLGGSGCQVWDSWKDFEQDWMGASIDFKKSYPFGRFVNLAPAWVFDEAVSR